MAFSTVYLAVAILAAQTHCIPHGNERRQETLPSFVNTYAPVVYLHSTENYFPSDIGAQVANTQPQNNYEVVTGAPSPLTLDNLDALNALNGSNIYLTSIESTTSNPQPQWLKGVIPGSTGKTNDAVSCSIIVCDYGNGTVDAYYMYFYAYNWGGKVLGLNFDDHVGDWEHTMTRFSNGVPQTMWYSQHGSGEAFEFSAIPKYDGGLRPIVYSANGSHANYATSGTHDHTIPGLDLPFGVALVDNTDQGYLWDPTLNAYYASVSFPSGTTPVFAAYDSTTPINWLNYVGKWGDEQYQSSYPGQYDIFDVYLTSILSALVIINYAQAVRLLGRVNPSTSELTWPSTGISFSFSGASASIGITYWGENSVALSIDGGNWTVISSVTGTSITTPTVTPGNHTVVLRKRSEANMGSIYIGEIVANGTLGSDAVPPKRQIEIIGDSITVGYGLDGVLPCTNTAAVEDNPKTYAALAADALGADYSVVAWSGKGLTRNYWGGVADDAVLMPDLYSRYGANDADNSYTFPTSWNPSAIVINLGTNDFSYVGTPPRSPLNATVFANAMTKFVQSIQQHYPNAWYFLMTSPMLSDGYPTAEDAQKTTQTNALKTVIAQLNNTKIQLVDWPTQGSDVGCDYHPNAATHAAEGVVLAAAVKAALQW